MRLDSRPRRHRHRVYLPHSAAIVFLCDGAMRRRPGAGDHAILARMRDLGPVGRFEAGALGMPRHVCIFTHGPTEMRFHLRLAEAELSAIYGRAEAGPVAVSSRRCYDFPDDSWSGVSMLRRLAEQSGRPVTFTLAQAIAASKGWRAWLCAWSKRPMKLAKVQFSPAQVFPRPIGLVLGHTLSVTPVRSPARPTRRWRGCRWKTKFVCSCAKPEIREIAPAEQNLGSQLRLPGFLARDTSTWMFPLPTRRRISEPRPKSSVGARARRLGRDARGGHPTTCCSRDNGKAMVLCRSGEFLQTPRSIPCAR